MWRHAENSGYARPEELDTTSSQKVVYVRKNIIFVEERTEEDQTFPAHYEWDEMTIPKEDWAVYEQVIGHGAALDDVYAALTELAEMIVEGM